MHRISQFYFIVQNFDSISYFSLYTLRNINYLLIQEEGHLPSKGLRTKLAKVLKSGNRPIPFDVTDLKIDDVEVEKLKSNTATNKNDHAPLNDHEVDELVKSLKVS